MKSRVYVMTTWYVFATSKTYPAIGHVSEVENPPLRFSDIKHLKLKELWHGATKTEFNGLVNLKAFAFGVEVPRGSNVVSARWVFTWKVDKAGCVIKPKASLAGRGFLAQGKQGFVFPVHLLVPLRLVCRYTDNINRRLVLRCREGVCVSSYTCNRRYYLWDYVEPREAFCYFLRIVSPTGCLVLPLPGTPFSSFLLISSPFCSFLLFSKVVRIRSFVCDTTRSRGLVK